MLIYYIGNYLVMGILMVGLTCGDRVREARTRLGYSQAVLAKKADVSQAAISKIENNDTDNSKYIASVAKALNTSMDYLIYGQEYIKRQSGSLDDFVIIGSDLAGQSPTSEEYILVPQFDIYGSCGAGSIIDTVEVKGGLVFSRKWLREQGVPNPDDLRVIYAKGESMYPSIEDGQVLLVNPHDTTPKTGKVYFLCIDGQYFVKRLLNMVTHWVVRSDNPDRMQYPDIKLSIDELRTKIEIEGRICWKGGVM